jgi:BlaI family transcriptional regulator, penicillinase repressor
MTLRSRSLGHDPAELGDLEREIMGIVWQGKTTAEDVRAQLTRPLKDSTVRTVLRRLEEKGYLKHALEKRTFVYQAAEPQLKVAARAVKKIADRFCDGSMEALLIGLVDSAVVDRKELRDLAEKIALAKRGVK